MCALRNQISLPLAAVFLAALLMPAVHAGETPVVDAEGRQPEARISGRVIDEAGEPVPGATVRFLPELETPNEWQSTAATDPAGNFVLQQLAAGPARLIAAADGRGAAEIDLALDAGQSLKDVVLHLRTDGPTLEGTIFDGQGRPLAGASVHVMLVMPLPDRGTATTDESGRFRFEEGLLLGETTLYASHPEGFGSIRRKVFIQPGWNEIALSFPAGRPVSGRVVNEDGMPVAGSSLRIESTDRLRTGCQATTAGDGSFTTCELPDGDYEIQAWAYGKGTTPRLPVQVSGGPVTDLELELGAFQAGSSEAETTGDGSI